MVGEEKSERGWESDERSVRGGVGKGGKEVGYGGSSWE